MSRKTQALSVLSLAMMAGLAAACSSGSPSSILTGSTSTAPAPASPPVAATPVDRATLAATTAAQAARCGYNFDPGRLRAGYLTYEAAQGTAAPELASLEKLYDTTRGRISAAIGSAEEFCVEETTDKIKRDLTRNLAGDFSAPVKRAPPPKSWWGSSGNEKFDQDKVLYPRGRAGAP
ncbi:MAG TPA: hypothetical protein VFV47_11815 [Hyphomicrobiaceae bacterium]|nr:hypothetical protein [Hyphomicrobiaceae bacterium]